MKHGILVFSLLTFLPMAANATVGRSYTHQLEAGLQGGGLFFEGSENLDDAGTFGARVGYNLTETVAVEGSVFFAGSELDNQNVDADVLLYGGEFLFHANRKQLRPFLVLGGGFLDLDPDNQSGSTDATFQWGGGLKWLLNDYVMARFDARHLLNVDDGEGPSTGLLTGGLSLFFGGEDLIDSDKDGVWDFRDDCPNTPQQIGVDRNGCPKDQDQDGVADKLDECPQTLAGQRVNVQGCVDTDGDGVTDAQDRCPNTPGSLAVNEQGCGDLDQDGFTDDVDQCIDKKETMNNFEDDDGCPDKRPIPKTTWILQGIRFKTGSAELELLSLQVLNDAYIILTDNPTVRVEVQGHTDSQGSAEVNLALSQRRANTVRDYLIEKGIAPDRMTAKGYGESRPIGDNEKIEGRAKNRRIEFKVLER